MEATIKTLATKDDISNLRKEFAENFSNLQKEVSANISSLRKEFGSDMSNFRTEVVESYSSLRKEIAEGKAENIKWMFIFWVGQLGAMLAIAFLFLKK